MATLFNTKIKDTYQSLLKLEDNTILTTTTKNITDGLGNASPLFMSTTQVRIGSTSGSAMYWDNVNNRLGVGTSTPTEKLDIVGNIKGTSNLVLGDAAGGSGGGFQAIRNANIYSSFLVHSQSKYLYLFTNPQGYSTGGFPASSTGMYSLGSIVFMPDGATAVTMLTNGNVLIGTTTDSGYKLDVNGTARLGGNNGYVTVTSYTNGATTMSVSNVGHHGATAIFASSAVGINAISVLGAGPNTPLGVGVAARRVVSPLVDSFTDADGVVNSTYKSIGLYAQRAIISNSGNASIMTNGTMLHVDGATVMSGSVTANSIPASPNTAYGLNIKNTLVAAANNDTLVALDINPTFTNGAFTGVKNIGLRVPSNVLIGGTTFYTQTTSGQSITSVLQVNGNISLISSSTTDRFNLIGSNPVSFWQARLDGAYGLSTILGITTSAGGYNGTLGGTTILAGMSTEIGGSLGVQSVIGVKSFIGLDGSTNRYIRFWEPGVAKRAVIGHTDSADGGHIVIRTGDATTLADGTQAVRIFQTTQNVLIGSSTTDSGYKLDVNGTTRIQGNTNVTGFLSATSYLECRTQFLLRNGLGGGHTGFSIDSTNLYLVNSTSINFQIGYSGNYSFILNNANRTIGMADNGATAITDASSVLTLTSTTKGFLPPRMTTAQKNAIATPATGLMVFDTDLVRPCFFNGATWITL
jgi:hypothetical protein